MKRLFNICESNTHFYGRFYGSSNFYLYANSELDDYEFAETRAVVVNSDNDPIGMAAASQKLPCKGYFHKGDLVMLRQRKTY